MMIDSDSPVISHKFAMLRFQITHGRILTHNPEHGLPFATHRAQSSNA